MHSRSILFSASESIQESLVFKKRTILDGKAHAGEVLINNFSGPKCKMTDFGVPFLVPRKTDGNAGGLEGSGRVVVLDVVLLQLLNPHSKLFVFVLHV